MAYSDLHEIPAAQDADAAILTGDLVRTGSNQFPQWRVIAIHGGTAWLRNVQTHVDGLAELARCRKVAPV